MLNQINLIGRLSQEPELRFTPNGRPVTSFDIACNYTYTNSEGTKVKVVDWFQIVAWGKLAEQCNQYLAKGQTVFISGKITLHQWDKQDGTKGSKLQVTAGKAVFLSKSNGSQEPSEELEQEDIPY